MIPVPARDTSGFQSGLGSSGGLQTNQQRGESWLNAYISVYPGARIWSMRFVLLVMAYAS
jgi:hypothetical protein